MLSRPAAIAALACAALVAGCGDEVDEDATLSIYASGPLRGPDEAAGRDIADGARLALEDAGGEAGGVAIEAFYLDNTSRVSGPLQWTQATVGANARTASRDSTTIAYIGELTSAATRVSLPITNAAGIPQVSPGAGAEDLVRDEPFNDEVPTDLQTSGERTFARVIPSDEDGRPAIPLHPRELPPEGRRFAREFERAFDREPGPYAAYGYEAMALVLDAIERASSPIDRAAVRDALLATRERDSVLGTYGIDPDTGETTLGGP